MPTVSGVVKEAGVPVKALVRVENRQSGALLGQAVSDETTGAYSVTVPTVEPVAVRRFRAPILAGDLLFSDVLLMVTGNSGIVDAKGHVLTPSGSVSESAAQSAFGTKSLYFSGGSVTTPSAGFDLGAGDFTIEFQMYSPVAWSSQSGGGPLSLSNMLNIYKNNSYSTDKLVLRDDTGNDYISNTPVPTATWVHWRYVRKSGVLILFKDGYVDAMWIHTRALFVTSTPVYIGEAAYWGAKLNGYLNNVRVTKASREWPDSIFNPPTAPFPTNATDDPHWASVVLLMNFSGANGSTSFSDVAGGGTVTVIGGAQISTAQSAVGGSSLRLAGGGDSVQLAMPSGFSFPTGDFTLDIVVYHYNYNSFQALFCINWDTNNTFILSSYNGTWYVHLNGKGFMGDPGGAHSHNSQWQTVTIERKGDNYSMYVDGFLVSVVERAGSINFPTTATVHLGSTSGNRDWFQGYVQAVRVTKGVARRTGSIPQVFTPPTAPLLADLQLGTPTGDAQIHDNVIPG